MFSYRATVLKAYQPAAAIPFNFCRHQCQEESSIRKMVFNFTSTEFDKGTKNRNRKHTSVISNHIFILYNVNLMICDFSKRRTPYCQLKIHVNAM